MDCTSHVGFAMHPMLRHPSTAFEVRGGTSEMSTTTALVSTGARGCETISTDRYMEAQEARG